MFFLGILPPPAPLQVPPSVAFINTATTLYLAGSLFGSLSVYEEQIKPLKIQKSHLNHCRHNKSSFQVRSEGWGVSFEDEQH